VRVLIVNSHGEDLSCGGAEQAVMELTGGLLAQGLDVAHLQAFPPRTHSHDVERTVIYDSDWRDDQVRRIKIHADAVVARPHARLEKAIVRHRPDVVHTHNLPGIGTGVWEICRRLGVPVVHTLWDYYLLCPRVTLTKRDATPCRPSPLLCGYRTRRLVRWAPAVSQVIGCSQYVVDRHAQFFPGAPFHVLRNPIEVEAGGIPAPRAKAAVVGYIGTIDRMKGVHLLLEAAPRLRALGLRLRLAGAGRLREEVAAAAESGSIEWVGRVLGDEKKRFFADCDLGIVPSVWAEPGGPTFTMAEWLAAGRPVLVSDRGGLGEVAGVYPGSIPVEPTVGAIVEGVAAVIDGTRWQEAVEAVGPVALESPAEWTARHEAIYRSAAGPRAAR
jgi:glycosyltransferase involved in cell wall biosynthesis